MDSITTRTEKIYRHSSGIIMCKVLDNIYMELADAKENIEAVRKIANGEKVLVLVDIRASNGASKETRDYFASEEASDYQIACAMIVNSPLSVLIGSFFLGLNKTIFPTKLFRSEESAMEWLQTFVK